MNGYRYPCPPLGLLGFAAVLICLSSGCQGLRTIQVFPSKIVRIKGQACVSHDCGRTWQDARAGDVIEPGDSIRTGDGTELDIILGNLTRPKAHGGAVNCWGQNQLMVARVYQGSVLRIDHVGRKNIGPGRPQIQLSLAAGRMEGRLNQPVTETPCELMVVFDGGVARTRGASFSLTAIGKVRVMGGEVAISVNKGPGRTRRVHAGYELDPNTGLIRKLPNRLPEMTSVGAAKLQSARAPSHHQSPDS